MLRKVFFGSWRAANQGRLRSERAWLIHVAHAPHVAGGHLVHPPRLCALALGTATSGGTRTLLFSAGINDEKDGPAGSINPAHGK